MSSKTIESIKSNSFIINKMADIDEDDIKIYYWDNQVQVKQI